MKVASAAVALAALGIAAGCGDSGSETTSTTTIDEPVACDAATIGAAVEAAVEKQEPSANVDPPYDFGCADGWAYALAEVGTGDQQVTVTFVFHSSGGAWTLQDRELVCTAPDDRVPEAIYEDACASD